MGAGNERALWGDSLRHHGSAQFPFLQKAKRCQNSIPLLGLLGGSMVTSVNPSVCGDRILTVALFFSFQRARPDSVSHFLPGMKL